MKNKIVKPIIALAAVFALSIGVTAAQLDFGTATLNGRNGSSTIRGGLYSGSSEPGYSYTADTKTTPAIGDGRTTEIKVRFPSNGDNGVSETRTNAVEVNDYGNMAVSSHYAYSAIDDVYISLPND